MISLLRNMNTILMFLLIVGGGNCGNNAKRKALLEDIRSNINDLISRLPEVNEMKHDLKMAINVIESTREQAQKLQETSEFIKGTTLSTSKHLINLEERMKKVEESNLKMNEIVKNRINVMNTNIETFKGSNDGKLRKMMNVLTSLYEMEKDLEMMRSSSSKPKYELDINLDAIKRALRESNSVLSVEIKDHLNKLTTTSVDIQTTLDLISGQILLVQDNLRTRTSDSYKEYVSGSNGAEQNKCPSVNVSAIVAEVKGQQNSLIEMVNSKLNEINDRVKVVKVEDEEKLGDGMVGDSKFVQAPPTIDLDLGNSIKEGRSLVRTIHPVVTRSSIRRGCQLNHAVSMAKNCQQIKVEGGATCDGVYVLMHQYKAFRVYCDMSQDPESGWTLIMRRGDFPHRKGPRISFNRDWISYKEGFGDLSDEFWLGNDHVHQLTTQQANMLQIDLESYDGQRLTLNYDEFHIGSEWDDYRLYVGKPRMSGKPGSSFTSHNNTRFSTADRGSAYRRHNCSTRYGAGWWFGAKKCYNVLLTGTSNLDKVQVPNSHQGIRWPSWKRHSVLKAVEMKIRPK